MLAVRHRLAIIFTTILLLASCTSIPITSLYKLYKLDPFSMSPQELRIIVRAHEAISIRKGNVAMEIGFKAHDGSLIIDDTYLVEVERNGSLPADVLDDKEPNEALTLLRLSEADAKQLANTQRLIEPYASSENEDDAASGSFGININNVCLTKPIPPEQSKLNLYLQTSVETGFFTFIKNLDMRKKLKDLEGGLKDIPLCTDSSE